MSDRPDDYREWLADKIEDDDRLEGHDLEVSTPVGVPLVIVSELDPSAPYDSDLWATIGADRQLARLQPGAPEELPAILDELGIEVVPVLKVKEVAS